MGGDLQIKEDSINKQRPSWGEVAKSLACKLRTYWTPSTHVKKPSVVACICNPSNGVQRKEDPWSSLACQLSLVREPSQFSPHETRMHQMKKKSEEKVLSDSSSKITPA